MKKLVALFLALLISVYGLSAFAEETITTFSVLNGVTFMDSKNDVQEKEPDAGESSYGDEKCLEKKFYLGDEDVSVMFFFKNDTLNEIIYMMTNSSLNELGSSSYKGASTPEEFSTLFATIKASLEKKYGSPLELETNQRYKYITSAYDKAIGFGNLIEFVEWLVPNNNGYVKIDMVYTGKKTQYGYQGRINVGYLHLSKEEVDENSQIEQTILDNF